MNMPTKALVKPTKPKVEALPITVSLTNKNIKIRDYESVKSATEGYLRSIDAPAISGLAFALGISRQSLYQYRKGGSGVHKEVSKLLQDAVAFIEKRVEEKLLNEIIQNEASRVRGEERNLRGRQDVGRSRRGAVRDGQT